MVMEEVTTETTSNVCSCIAGIRGRHPKDEQERKIRIAHNIKAAESKKICPIHKMAPSVSRASTAAVKSTSGKEWRKRDYQIPEIKSDFTLTLPDTPYYRWASQDGNGAQLGSVVEFELSQQHPDYIPITGNDFMDAVVFGKTSETRTLKDMIIFRPSAQIGVGRKYDNLVFHEKLKLIEQWIVVDTMYANDNSSLPVFFISREIMLSWFNLGHFGKNGQMGRKKFMYLLNREQNGSNENTVYVGGQQG